MHVAIHAESIQAGLDTGHSSVHQTPRGELTMRAGVKSRSYDRDPRFARRSTEQSGRSNPTTKHSLGPG